MRPLVVLWKPKCAENIGHALRACACYGADLAVVEPRCKLAKAKTRRRWQATATFAKDRTFAVLSEAELHDRLTAYIVIPIEKSEDAERLEKLNHPRVGAYLFGPEEGAIPSRLFELYGPPVQIPTVGCLNLAAAVATVLYDRAAKKERSLEMEREMEKTFRRWLADGKSWIGIFQNQDLSHPDIGRKVALAFDVEQNARLGTRCPDVNIPPINGIGWRYLLIAKADTVEKALKEMEEKNG